MKIYISGRMTGVAPEVYKERFAEMEKTLKKLGYKVVNPAKFIFCRFEWLNKLLGYEKCLKIDISKLKKCDAICMFGDWKFSQGAKREKKAAEEQGLKILYYTKSKGLYE